jgi:prolyl-tRNA editing enzyme YbaK/EbsC (Cys-tRNA(Pro) deacylase)
LFAYERVIRNRLQGKPKNIGGVLLEGIRSLLQENNIQYEFIQHDVHISTAQDGARYFGIDIGQTAPTLILSTDKGYYAVIISGNRNVDYDNIANLLGCKKVKLASSKEVKDTTGYSIGSIPLIGLNLPYILDKQLFQNEFIYGGSGDSTYTLKVDPAALRKLNNCVAYIE